MRLSTSPHSVEGWGWHSEAAAAARDEKEEGPLPVPVLRVAGKRTRSTWGFHSTVRGPHPGGRRRGSRVSRGGVGGFSREHGPHGS